MGFSDEPTPAEFNRPFASLKERLEHSPPVPPDPAPAPQPLEAPSDEEMLREAMRDVREIKEFRGLRPAARPCTAVRCPDIRELDAASALKDIVAGRQTVDLARTQEYVSWVHPDFHGEIIRRLASGRFSVQDVLDLHGLTLAEAEEVVNAFIQVARRRGLRCVRIIHGRGLRSPSGPVIKEALVEWLSRRYRKQVIAFVTARQCDGGLGALYILLR